MDDEFPQDNSLDPGLPAATDQPAATGGQSAPDQAAAIELPAESSEAELPEETPRQPKPASKPALVINIHSWATPIIGILMLVIGLAGGYFGRPFITNVKPADASTNSQGQANGPASQEKSPVSTPTLMEYLAGQTRHFQGDPNAPITLIEFSDFQCPYCGKFARETEPQIYDQYVKTGKVRLGYIHFTFLGDESQWAAEASECANDQNAFWEYHDYLFAHQSSENLGAFSKENLKKFAVALNLNTEQFNRCLDSGHYTDVVKSQTAMGQNLGVSSTPTLVINGKVLLGAQPFETFQQVIDSDLSGQ
jgi:protein-disulfide isomerase